MKASKLMVWFHLSFLVFSLVALFLIATEIIVLDWLALWTIVAAVALNAFFAVMWYDESRGRQAEKPEVRTDEIRGFPMVSFVVSSHNQEPSISHSVKNLFKCASDYRGPSEIIIVDDGSTDHTYESAWIAIDSMHKELPNIRALVIKHMARLGRTEVVKTGANKAMGEYLALVDATTPCDAVSLNKLVDSISSTEKTMISYEVTVQSNEDKTATSHSIVLAQADTLRRLLNREKTENATDELRI